jgi:ABC-type glycerol-3-phosphate transport system substrate-binding protein
MAQNPVPVSANPSAPQPPANEPVKAAASVAPISSAAPAAPSLPPPSAIKKAPVVATTPALPTASSPTTLQASKTQATTFARPTSGNSAVTLNGSSASRPLPPSSSTPTLSPAPPLGSGQGGKLPPQPPSSSSSAAGKMAEIRQSPLRFIPFIVGGLLLLLIGWFIFSRFFSAQPQTSDTPGTANVPGAKTSASATLTYWGLWEPTPVMQEVISDYEQSHPGIKVNYQQQSYKDYRERLQTAVVSGRGPDIFRFHASWVPMLKQELNPMPTTVYTIAEFEQSFYPVARQNLTLNEQIVGVPLMYDGLALFYNEEMLRTANVQPPKTWAEVKKLANQLTIRSGNRIQRGGIALGNATNVEHFSDILGLLMLQNGADPTNPLGPAAEDALVFYTNFVKEDKVWDDTLPSSSVAFARGDVAMMVAPSWRIHDIQALNPNLKFSTAPIPQLSDNKVTWGTYWAEGVNAQSKNKAEAWAFLKYLTSADVLRKFQSAASKTRSFGELYPRTDMSSEMGSTQFTSAYLLDAPYAKNWYLNSATHDNGINDLLIKYYEDAITATVQGAAPSEVLKTVAQGTTQILRQYGLAVSAAVGTSTGQ